MTTTQNYPVKRISIEDKPTGLSEFPNFHKSGSVIGMKKKHYGEDALLLQCGDFIYNVSSAPDYYFDYFKEWRKYDDKINLIPVRTNKSKSENFYWGWSSNAGDWIKTSEIDKTAG
ncbi:hypothetical protein [Epilithonimonas sp.]|uniref:hypothetical protein n=1 Tax=Epilithonimonas sp. TaxID=2894511 RepID=UPI0035AE5DC1